MSLLCASSIFMELIKKSEKNEGFFIKNMKQIHFIYINVEPERKMKKYPRKLKTCVDQIVYFERKLGFMVYMMN
jgi:hypothetical protein